MSDGNQLYGADELMSASFKIDREEWAAFGDVADELDESRSELLRRYVRRRVERHGTDSGRAPPTEEPLRSAWRVLARHAGEWVRWRHVASELAQATGTPKDVLWSSVVRELAERGYVKPYSGVGPGQKRLFVRE